MAFTSEVLAQRTSTGERRTVKEQGTTGSCFGDISALMHPHFYAPWQSTDVMCM